MKNTRIKADTKSDFWLSYEHQAKGLDIFHNNLAKRYKKKDCSWCNNRRVKAINAENCLIPCSRCVIYHDALKEWLEYCKQHPELEERFIKNEQSKKEDISQQKEST